MINEYTLPYCTINEILAELKRRGVVVSIRGVGMYPLVEAITTVHRCPDQSYVEAIEIPSTAEAPSADGGRPLSRAFDANQYFLDLVSRGVSAARARRLANLAADVDALAGSLAKEDGK